MPRVIDNLKKRRARELELLKETQEILGEVKDDELGSPPGSENYEEMYNQPESEGGDPKKIKKIKKMKTGGFSRGGGAAVIGTKFEGVF